MRVGGDLDRIAVGDASTRIFVPAFVPRISRRRAFRDLVGPVPLIARFHARSGSRDPQPAAPGGVARRAAAAPRAFLLMLGVTLVPGSYGFSGSVQGSAGPAAAACQASANAIGSRAFFVAVQGGWMAGKAKRLFSGSSWGCS